MSDVLELTVPESETLPQPQDSVDTFPKCVARHRRKISSRRHLTIRPWTNANKMIQMYRHKDSFLVLCFRNHGYCLTDGITSFVRQDDPDLDKSLLRHLSETFVNKLYVTDEASLYRWAILRRRLKGNHPLTELPVINMKMNAGNCPTCGKNCMRWAAIVTLYALLTARIFTMLGLRMFTVPPVISPIPDEESVPVLSIPESVTQVFKHQKTMVVLCINTGGFTVSTGEVSYSSERISRKLLRKVLSKMNAGNVFFTDPGTKRFYKKLFTKLRLPYTTYLINHRPIPIDVCLFALLDQSEDVFTLYQSIKGLAFNPPDHIFSCSDSVRFTMDSVQYIALADWMMKDGKWRVRRLAFSPTVHPDETLVVVPTKESWGNFSYQDMETNCTVHPLNGFPKEICMGREFKVELESMENFLRGQFYMTILKNPDAWDIKIGTFDMATFMFLQPLWKDKIVFLGERLNVETEVCRQMRKCMSSF
ncbi:hypothetical protein HNY73_012817 [Argiope bruennichi]|uniref:Uncharacterized protein n=1 Tax=Argiope bruennichi TaxID=94029 RepID=A0A8T0F0X0_ARGBR|nr:hypothetical protein HNY73_012817 [Argiope bruennichi]